MPTKAFILGSELIKAGEQMVQTWSGHNETVSGETNRTRLDSCEVTRIQVSPRSETLLRPREWNYNRIKTLKLLFKKRLDQTVFTSS